MANHGCTRSLSVTGGSPTCDDTSEVNVPHTSCEMTDSTSHRSAALVVGGLGVGCPSGSVASSAFVLLGGGVPCQTAVADLHGVVDGSDDSGPSP